MNRIDAGRHERAFIPSTFTARRWEFAALVIEAFALIAALAALLPPLSKLGDPVQSIFGHAALYFGVMLVVLPVHSIAARSYGGREVPVLRHLAWGAVFSLLAAAALVAIRSL